ncbi:MAG TPA: amidohydrolase family protein [Burkholderiales bacterium]|nr:amidohydrolase family protein [Burkholderiales bacterium]
MRRIVLLMAAWVPVAVAAADLPLFDAHLHYSHDAWESVPPAQAIAVLRKAGVKRALVSSSGDDGQQRLAAGAPDLIIPELRPYRSRADTGTWFRDETVIPYLEDRLTKYKYAGIGEFHLYGDNADLAVPRRMVELAKRHNLFLHAHSDTDAVERLFRQWPQARILWAHSGFERPDRVREMLRKHGNLWADLAFRTDQAQGGKVDPEWRAAFLEFPDRFLLGTDTYVPERWHYIPEHAVWARGWLADLPPEVAERIAFRNGEALFASKK